MKALFIISLLTTSIFTFAQQFDHQKGSFLNNNDAKIYYEETGNTKGPVLLLIHGGFGNLEDFNPIISNFDSTYRIIGIDSRGHGKSTLGSKGLSYELIQHDIEAVLKHLSIDSLSIIGFSDGGIVAYRLASFSSIHIKKLITIGSRWNVKNTESQKNDWLNITGKSMRENAPYIYDIYQKLNPKPDFNLFTKSSINMWLDSTMAGHPAYAVKKISCEVLIVRGDNDPFISLDDVAELSKLINNSTLLNIPFAGHSALFDQKEIFLKVANQFMRNN